MYSTTQPSNILPPLYPPQLDYGSGQYYPWMPFGNLPTYQPPPNPPYSYRSREIRDNSNLFLFHLPSTTDERGLEALFRPFGTIVSTKLFRHAKTKESMGFGFVAFDNPLSAQLAIQCMNGFPIENKRLFVSLKQPKVLPTAENQKGNRGSTS
nr:hypothetical transcript [Hymenolepis microstoma]